MNIIVKRKLKDFESWKKVVSNLDGMRKSYGSKGFTTYRSASDPNEVFLVFDWDDKKSFKDYINNPEVQKAINDTGTMEVFEVSETFHLAE